MRCSPFPVLRPDKVLKLYQELGVSSVAELWEAAREGRLQKIKGLGASLQTRILRGVEIQREAQGRRHMHRAAELLKAAEKHLREARPDIIYVTAAGDFRRGCELWATFRLSQRSENCRVARRRSRRVGN